MSKSAKILTVVAIIAGAIAILAVPGSLYFEEGTDKGTLLWTAAAAAAVAIGFACGAFIFKAGNSVEAKEIRLPEFSQKAAPKAEKRGLPAWGRVLLAILGLALAVGVMLIPSSSYFGGQGPEAIWLVGVVAAVGLGLALIHWIMNQGFMQDDDEFEEIGEYNSSLAAMTTTDKGPNYALWLVVAAVLIAFTVILTVTELGTSYPILSFVAIITAMASGLILAILATRKMDEVDKNTPKKSAFSANRYYEEKPAKAASPAVRWGAFVLLALAAGTMIAVPTTSFFGEQGEFTVLSFLASGAAMAIGLGLGYWLLRQALAASEKSDNEDEFADEFATPEPPKERPAWMRHILLILAILLAIFTATVPAVEYYSSGNTYATGWFLAAMSALAVGALFGYWLKLQGEAAAKEAEKTEDKFKEDKPFVFPPWAKWAVLAALLVLLLVVAILGSGAGYYTGTGSSWLEIALAVGAIIGGIGIGIWFTKHFDQMARDAYAKRQQNTTYTSNITYNTNSDDKFERK